MRYFFSFLFAATSFFCHGQNGHYFLSHHAPGDERVDHIAYDMAQDAAGIMYFATRSGVLQYDGRNWDLIEGNGAVYSIEICQDNTIFWCGANGFGKIKVSPDGVKQIEVLSKADDHNIYQTACIKNQLYFLSEEVIYSYSANDSITITRSTNLTGAFSYLFEMHGKVYVSTDRSQVFEFQNNNLRVASFNEDGLEIIFSSKFENQYLLGTLDNRLFISTRPGVLTPINVADETYMNASVVIDGAWLHPNLIALATLRGGVIFLNPITGETEEIINYHTGLPDNEVHALMGDRNRNIWIAHEYGFTRIEPFLPFRSFSHYDGLKGNLLCAKTHNNKVYVGTSLGLYQLVKEEVYDEIVYYEEVVEEIADKPYEEVKAVSPTPNAKREEQKKVEPVQEPEKKKRGFLKFLKRNRTTLDEPKSVEERQVTEEKNEEPTPASETAATRSITRRLKKTERLLRSAQYVYKKVEGIDAKISHLVEIDDKLIAAGLGGVFEIANLSAKVILEEPVRYIYSSHDSTLYASTYADRVRTLKLNKGKWEQLNLLTNLNDQISFIFEPRQNEIWLCAYDVVYTMQIENGVVKNIAQTQFSNPTFSKTLGVTINGKIVLVNGNGFFNVDESKNATTRMDSLPSPRTYFVTNGELIYYDDHAWKKFGNGNDSQSIQMLNIADDIRYLSANGNPHNLWVIMGNNELHKFFGDRIKVYTTKYPLLLKSVMQGENRLRLSTRQKIEQDNGALQFEMVQPDFSGTDAIEYRYFLKGITENWSAWSTTNSKINFPFLPVGNYSLAVQARDIFGNVSEMDSISVEVLPPFWKRPWFYAMEFSIFALLVLVSFKLSVRYRFVSRLLSLLTIILLIEFIQTIAGSAFTTNSSPVIDFMIQVGVAFMILPVEGYLRDLMFKSMGSDSRLYKVISDLKKSEKK